jgi:hypothetical protein
MSRAGTGTSWIFERTSFSGRILILAMLTRLTPLTRRMAGWFVLILVASLRLRGEVLETINSLTITNLTGYVIASDAVFGGAGHTRDTIDVQSEVSYTRSISNTNYVFDYTYQYRLLDEAGVAQSLRDGFDVGTVVSREVTINRTFVLPYLPVLRTVRLLPANRLDPYQQYRVELRLLRRISGSLGRPTATGDSLATTPATFLHFPSTTPTDADVNVIPVLNTVNWSRTYLLTDGGSKSNLQVQTGFRAYRWDRWNLSRQTNEITFYFDLELTDAATAEVIPLVQSRIPVTRAMATYTDGSPAAPTVANLNATLSFSPSVQLDPINKTYRLKVRIGHFPTGGLTTLAGNEIEVAPRRLLHLNGRLDFGAIQTRYGSLGNDPVQGVISGGTMPTSLAVNNQSGGLAGFPAHTYGDGTALSVRVSSNGTAVLSAGAVVMTGPDPDEEELENVRFRRGPVTLDTTGARASVLAVLPAGFGYAFDTLGKRLIGQFLFGGVQLTQQLVPINDPTAVFAGGLWGVEETKPLWMKFTGVRWVKGEGRFEWESTGDVEYVRRAEYERLAASPATTGRVKVSNERYYQYVDKVTSPTVVVEAGSNGAALMTARFSFKNGAFQSHFPLATAMTWAAGGEQVVVKDEVDPTQSLLPGAQVLSAYSRDCQEVDCGVEAGVDTLLLNPTDGELRFTPDGGLHANGLLNAAKRISWGWISNPAIQKYANETDPFESGAYLMAGHYLRGDRATNTVIFQKPGTILFSGFTVSNSVLTRVERPRSGSYAVGFADYAGMNFRVTADGAKKAESVIAGRETGLYPLTGRSKYYVRPGGVNGIHEAVFGQFPESFVLYGYPVNFSNFGLVYLDTLNVDSRTEGQVRVPGPSSFNQNFEELRFTCLGALDVAKVPASEGELVKVLEYWQADFVTRSILFDRKATDSCDPGKGVLTLGVDAYFYIVRPSGSRASRRCLLSIALFRRS